MAVEGSHNVDEGKKLKNDFFKWDIDGKGMLGILTGEKPIGYKKKISDTEQ